mmetsp:Transcript_93789/g.271029  ORF Transcript_93789/g.271029 Transcript_93789/m.271029 type:complete len:325 (+) Transcript_93789:729-1703(+)
MYSQMLSSVRPCKRRKEFASLAWITATLSSSALRHKISPAIDFSLRTKCARSEVIFQKIFWSSCVVFANKLVPCSNWRTTNTGVCFLSIVNNEMTTLMAVSKICVLSRATSWPPRSSPSIGTQPASCGGTTCTNACTSSVGMAALRCRNTATVLRNNSTAILELSPGRGPIVPKIGIIWNCVAQCVTMCSASSTLPTPTSPSSTTMPPSPKGLPCGAFCLGAVVGIVCCCWWRALLKLPPSISITFTMPAHRFTEHNCMTFAFDCCTASFPPEQSIPSIGRSYHGNCNFLSTVRPTGSALSLSMGLKIEIALALPLTWMGANAL